MTTPTEGVVSQLANMSRTRSPTNPMELSMPNNEAILVQGANVSDNHRADVSTVLKRGSTNISMVSYDRSNTMLPIQVVPVRL